VEQAFRRNAEGEDPPPRVLGLPVADGGFHAKAAVLGRYFAAKLNGNFPLNPQRTGRPTIQGVVILADATDGRVLAVMDSIEITILRTAAATALAARHLARPDATVATICGCGTQGRIQFEALLTTHAFKRVFAHDRDRAASDLFARERAATLGVPVEVADDLESAVRRSDIVVTCTPAREPLIRAADIRPGTFIAGVGADNEDKQELEPALLARATVVVDSLEQCAAIGDLHHALAAGLITRSAVHAELGQIVAGLRPGRTTPEEITVFDSTGTALQDVAAAAMVYERARAATAAGTRIDLMSCSTTRCQEVSMAESPFVLFVCLHGSAKSVIASQYFRRFAAERGLAAESVAAGTEPDAVIPPGVVEGLRGDGIDVAGLQPRPVMRTDLERASLVVAFGCRLDDPPRGLAIQRWDDMPAVSEDFGRARDAIAARVRTLVDQIGSA